MTTTPEVIAEARRMLGMAKDWEGEQHPPHDQSELIHRWKQRQDMVPVLEQRSMAYSLLAIAEALNRIAETAPTDTPSLPL